MKIHYKSCGSVGEVLIPSTQIYHEKVCMQNLADEIGSYLDISG